MKPGASKLKWCISLAVVACVIFAAVGAFAQNAQGLAAVGAIDPANGYPRWYLDKNGLQLGQCLDAANPADPCAIVGTFPNPGQPISFPNNFPDEFFYWRTTATINNIGNVGGRALLVMSTQAGFGGARANVVQTHLFTNVIRKIYVRPATSTTLNSTPNPSVFGQAVTLTATVAPVLTDPLVPTGSVTFKDGATTLGTVALVNGSASLVTSALAAGSHSLTASYSGSLEFAVSTSAVRTQTVNPGQTTTTLTSTPNPSLAGQTVTLSTTVTAVAPAVGVPTGTVTFRDGATALGTVTLVNGNASLNVSTLTVGSHSLTAVYNGSPKFLR